MVGLEPSILRRVPPQIYQCKLAVAVVENSLRRRHSVAATQQIADGLKKLGMSEYADRFVDNRIDPSVLPDLTDQDLEKLGVLLSDRRKILRAIRDLGDVSVDVTALSAPVAIEPPRRDDAERRQLTAIIRRPRWLHGAVGQARPGGSAFCNRRVSQVCRGDGRPIRRLRGQIHGRWGVRLFRLSAGP
jgi:hypothetical protein